MKRPWVFLVQLVFITAISFTMVSDAYSITPPETPEERAERERKRAVLVSVAPHSPLQFSEETSSGDEVPEKKGAEPKDEGLKGDSPRKGEIGSVEDKILTKLEELEESREGRVDRRAPEALDKKAPPEEDGVEEAVEIETADYKEESAPENEAQEEAPDPEDWNQPI